MLTPFVYRLASAQETWVPPVCGYWCRTTGELAENTPMLVTLDGYRITLPVPAILPEPRV